MSKIGWLALVISIIMVGLSLLLKWPTRPSIHFDQLPQYLRSWFLRGSLYEILPARHMFAIIDGAENATDTLIFIHGFPSSSWDYHRALPFLRQSKLSLRLVLFDHVGFGFSDKPANNVTYTIGQHVDHMLLLWRKLNLQGRVHLIAHDMGDSILAELITRAYLQLLPEEFSYTSFPTSVMFTNGGMLVDHIGFRLSQRLLMSPTFGALVNAISLRLPESILRHIQRQQLLSIWGQRVSLLQALKDCDDLAYMNDLASGNAILHKTIRYLQDRFEFEPRWLDALKHIKIPCQLLWGNSDAVSPPILAETLHKEVMPFCKLNWLNNTGHFIMLERPEEWATHVMYQASAHA